MMKSYLIAQACCAALHRCGLDSVRRLKAKGHEATGASLLRREGRGVDSVGLISEINTDRKASSVTGYSCD
ncbi:wingless-type MMTV integration site family, member 2 [Sarotherodon galilaeus]